MSERNISLAERENEESDGEEKGAEVRIHAVSTSFEHDSSDDEKSTEVKGEDEDFDETVDHPYFSLEGGIGGERADIDSDEEEEEFSEFVEGRTLESALGLDNANRFVERALARIDGDHLHFGGGLANQATDGMNIFEVVESEGERRAWEEHYLSPASDPSPAPAPFEPRISIPPLSQEKIEQIKSCMAGIKLKPREGANLIAKALKNTRLGDELSAGPQAETAAASAADFASFDS